MESATTWRSVHLRTECSYYLRRICNKGLVQKYVKWIVISVITKKSLKIAANEHTSFTVAILLFLRERSWIKFKSYRERPTALLEMTRLVKSVPARALLNYTRPWTSSLLSSIVKMNILFTRVQSEFWAFQADRLDCVSASCPRSCVRKGCKFSSIVGCKKDYETVQMDIHSFASKCNA